MCSFSELRCKEVINICDGSRLGYVCDLTLDESCGRICSVIIPGPAKFFGLFGRGEDYVVPWEKIKRIGEDIILVDVQFPCAGGRKGGGGEGIFNF